MLIGVFLLLLALAIGLLAYGLSKRDPVIFALGSLLTLGVGLLLMGSFPSTGLEQSNGFLVNYVGDNNYVVDYNISYRNAGNDVSLNVLSTLFFWLGAVGLMASLGLLIKGGLDGRRGRRR